jgi:chondroitin 4-sulfotransferase 11
MVIKSKVISITYMISDKHKVAFLHVPKCAGTSIESYLRDFEFHIKDHYHTTHRELLENDKYKNYYKFSFTRNPYDKMVSEFKWYTDQSNKWNSPHCKKYYKDVDFKTFVNKFLTLHPGDPYHLYSQYSILTPLKGIDFIGRFESLQEDFDTVCDKIGIPQQELPNKYKSKHKHYTEYYDDETRQVVSEKYVRDVEYFNYKFGE